MNLFLKSYVGLFLCLFCINVSASNGWKFEEEIEGIRVFTKQEVGNPIKSFRGEMTIKSRLTPLVALLDDVKAYSTWLYNCQSAKQLKAISDNESINYLVTKMPWPAVTRDSVIYTKLNQNLQTKQIVIDLLSRPNQYPIQNGKVRIINLFGRWVLIPDNKGNLSVIYEMNIDPAGNLPKWLVNSMSIDFPKQTLLKIKQRIKDAKYQKAVLKNIQE